MTLTTKLRWVKRARPGGAILILQQWWEFDLDDTQPLHGESGEWRDIPMETE